VDKVTGGIITIDAISSYCIYAKRPTSVNAETVKLRVVWYFGGQDATKRVIGTIDNYTPTVSVGYSSGTFGDSGIMSMTELLRIWRELICRAGFVI
jgi:hypothetical protein